MEGCRLSFRGLALIFFHLKSNHTVVELSLAENDFSMPDLKDTTSNTNNLTDKDLKEMESWISDLFITNNFLKTLSLSRCKIGDHLGRLISRSIGASCSLEKLDLSWNELTDDSMGVFFRGIFQSSIEVLNLSSNKLKDKCA